MRFSKFCVGALLLAAATPAFAQDEAESSAITVTGSATVVSDYRFRGFSQTSEDPTIQGGFTIGHESGVYVGTWGSGISFANGTEIDVFAGYAKEVIPGLTADIGATVYLYPGTSDTTIIEPYFAVSGDIGPAFVKSGIAWAPSGQDSLADDSAIYVYADAAVAIPTTPIKLKGHLGYAKSDSFLGGFDGDVVDYLVGVDVSWNVLTLGIAYVNTNEPTAAGWKETLGADGTVLFTLGAAF